MVFFQVVQTVLLHLAWAHHVKLAYGAGLVQMYLRLVQRLVIVALHLVQKKMPAAYVMVMVLPVLTVQVCLMVIPL
jgi:hypothetical protein